MLVLGVVSDTCSKGYCMHNSTTDYSFVTITYKNHPTQKIHSPYISPQGTNAHAILSSIHTTTPANRAPLNTLHPTHAQRLWVLPPALLAARTGTLSPPSPFIHIQSAPLATHPRCAFLLDHVVAGTPLLPATAMCDAMLAALCVCAGDEHLQSLLVLTDVRFLQPLVLHGQDMGAVSKGSRLESKGSRLDIMVDMETGALQVLSGASRIAMATVRVGAVTTNHGDDLPTCDTHPPTRSSSKSQLLCVAPVCAVVSSVAHIAAQHGHSTAREGLLLQPDIADAVLQLGVVHVGSPVKIPTALEVLAVHQVGAGSTRGWGGVGAEGGYLPAQHQVMAACVSAQSGSTTHSGSFATTHGVVFGGLSTTTVLPGVLAAQQELHGTSAHDAMQQCVFSTHTPVVGVATPPDHPCMLTMHDTMATHHNAAMHAALTAIAAAQHGVLVHNVGVGLCAAAAEGVGRVVYTEQHTALEEYCKTKGCGYAPDGVERASVLRSYEVEHLPEHVCLQGVGSFDRLTKVAVDVQHVGDEDVVVCIEV